MPVLVLQAAVPGEGPIPDDGVYRIGKLTLEERRQKILRYRQKRHERNFKKKIKYVCRKTLADSRPRVRGRFARNTDEDAVRPTAPPPRPTNPPACPPYVPPPPLLDCADSLEAFGCFRKCPR